MAAVTPMKLPQVILSMVSTDPTPPLQFTDKKMSVAFSERPEEFVAVSDGTSICSAFRVGPRWIQMLAYIEKLAKDTKAAKKALQSEEHILLEEISTWRNRAITARYNVETVIDEIYIGGHRANHEQRKRLVRRKGEQQEALENKRAAKDRYKQLVHAVHVAERRHLAQFEELRTIYLEAEGKAKAPTKQAKEPFTAGIPLDTPHALAKPHSATGITEGDPEIYFEPSHSDNEICSLVHRATTKGIENRPIVGEDKEKQHPIGKSVRAIPAAAQNLSQALKRLRRVASEFGRHREDYDNQLQRYRNQAKPPMKGTETEFGPIYFREGAKLTRDLDDAEKAFKIAKVKAKEAGVPFNVHQCSDFASIEDEGYTQRLENLLIESCNKKHVESWISQLPSFEELGDPDQPLQEEAESNGDDLFRGEESWNEWCKKVAEVNMRPEDSLSNFEAPGWQKKVNDWATFSRQAFREHIPWSGIDRENYVEELGRVSNISHPEIDGKPFTTESKTENSTQGIRMSVFEHTHDQATQTVESGTEDRLRKKIKVSPKDASYDSTVGHYLLPEEVDPMDLDCDEPALRKVPSKKSKPTTWREGEEKRRRAVLSRKAKSKRPNYRV